MSADDVGADDVGADDVGPSIVVAGGGTGGHIEPALALADAVLRLDPTATITALGTARGLETTVVPARGYRLELIPAASLPRRLTPDLLRVPGRMRAAVRAAAEVLEAVEAQAVVGFGGYVSLPAYLAARRLRIPFAVHEANARPGLANRIAARMTRNVYTASPAIKLRNAQPIGMPLRRSITTLDLPARRPAARAALGLDPDRPTLLVTGGSQGAQSINAAALGAAAALAGAGIQVLHVAGPKNDLPAPVRSPGAPPYVLVPFLDGLADAYAAADLVLCRCGAMTCAELTALGLPAAYVPYPHGNGEQRLNAQPIVAAGGGLLVADAECTPDWIVDSVIPVLGDAERLGAMSAAAAGSGASDADEVLARAALALAADHRDKHAGPAQTGEPR